MLTYHKRAKTTYAIRKEIKENPEGLTVMQQAKKYNVCNRTILKWRHREVFEDAKHGARNPRKSISDLEEYVICEIRKTALLSIDDLLDVVNELGISITRSSLDRALQRNGLGNLQKYIASLNEEKTHKHKEFKTYEAGFIHIDIKYLPKIDGIRHYLFVAIDRATRIVFSKIYSDKSKQSANKFLNQVISYFPFAIKRILTDNGKEFTDRFSRNRKTPTGNHIFDQTCKSNQIEHRLTKAYSPQTNGMVERVNGKITENVLNKIKFKTILEMEATIMNYIYNYNFHIKHSSIGRKTPMQTLQKIWNHKNNSIKFRRRNFDEFYNLNEKLISNYRMGYDN